jgi:hypothetical protein
VAAAIKAAGDLALSAAKPKLAELTKATAEKVLPRLFGEYGAKALTIATSAAARVIGSAALTILEPEKVSPEFYELIADKAGKYSLADKQRALAQGTWEYEQFGDRWDDGMVRRLVQSYLIVYEESERQNGQ